MLRKILYQGKFIKMEEVTDGEVIREIVSGTKASHAVAAIIFNECENKVLLVKQKRLAVSEEDGQMTWEIPAGMMDIEGEDQTATMKRELEEETGLKVPILHKLFSYYPNIGMSTHKLHLYVGGADEADLKDEIDDEDVVEAKWFKVEEVHKMIEDGKIFDGKTIIAFYRMAQSIEGDIWRESDGEV